MVKTTYFTSFLEVHVFGLVLGLQQIRTSNIEFTVNCYENAQHEEAEYSLLDPVNEHIVERVDTMNIGLHASLATIEVLQEVDNLHYGPSSHR